MKYIRNIFFIFSFVYIFSCEKKEECDCQKEGIQIFQLVTDDDIDILEEVEGIELNECIRYDLESFFSDQIDYETVQVVDYCCCE